MKPGGWVEFQDFNLKYYSDDDTLKDDSDTSIWVDILLDASRKNGREPSPGPLLEGWVKDVGFTNIHHEKVKLPIGPWAKDKRKVGSTIETLWVDAVTNITSSDFYRKKLAYSISFRFSMDSRHSRIDS